MEYAKAFEQITELAGTKVILRPVSIEMAGELFAAAAESREELRRFMPWENKTVDEARSFIERSGERRAAGSQLDLFVLAKQTRQFLGGIGLHKFDPFTPKAEVGYWIRSSMHRRGYACDAVMTLLEFCRERLELVRIDACVARDNAASQKVLTNAGFIEEGFKRRACLCHDVWQDLKLFGKLLA